MYYEAVYCSVVCGVAGVLLRYPELIVMWCVEINDVEVMSLVIH